MEIALYTHSKVFNGGFRSTFKTFHKNLSNAHYTFTWCFKMAIEKTFYGNRITYTLSKRFNFLKVYETDYIVSCDLTHITNRNKAFYLFCVLIHYDFSKCFSNMFSFHVSTLVGFPMFRVKLIVLSVTYRKRFSYEHNILFCFRISAMPT